MDDLKRERGFVEEALSKMRPEPSVEPGQALSVAWVLLSEWVLPDGGRRLVRLDSEGITTWQWKGMLHDALFQDGTWQTINPDED